MKEKKPYTTPVIKKYSRIEDMPSSQRPIAKILLQEAVGEYDSIIDRERRWVSLSEDFAALLGYRVMDLVGRKIDDLTVPESTDLDFAFKVFFQIGTMDRVLIFLHREGKKVVVRYRARLADDFSYAEVKPLLVA